MHRIWWRKLLKAKSTRTERNSGSPLNSFYPLFDNGSFAEYGRGKDIDALWRLVLKVPEGISTILIENLPADAGLSSGIPDDVLSGMSDGQLTILFNREDIHLRELRKKLFFEASDERGEVKLAAIRYNFDLDYTEFGTILTLPKKEAGNVIGYLCSARNLSLCLYKAIYDVSMQTDMFDALDAEFAAKALDRRLEELTGWERKKQLRDLSLYQLAKHAVPWKKGEDSYLPSEELEFLSKVVVEGDTWGTFMAYANARAENSPNSRNLEKYLTRFDEPGEDEAGQIHDEDERKYTNLVDRIEKLTETASSLAEQAKGKQIELTEIVRGLSRDAAGLQAAQERQTQLLDELITDVTGLQATQERQSLLLYLVVGLLVWLLIKIL